MWKSKHILCVLSATFNAFEIYKIVSTKDRKMLRLSG